MAQPPEAASRRIAYIRTVSRPDQGVHEISELFYKRIRQATLTEINDGGSRHVFFFAAVNTSDRRLLEWILSYVASRDPQSKEDEPKGYCGLGGTYCLVCRSDFQLHMCESRASSKAGRKLLQLCATEGIKTAISGTTDEECDEMMLNSSHYLIDSYTQQYIWNLEYWFDRARGGKPERHEFNEAQYVKMDISRMRLRNRYLGHGWTASSGGYHGNGSWWCKVCGGKCKRGKCKSGGAALLEEEARNAAHAKILDECEISNNNPSYRHGFPADPTAAHHPSCGGRCKRGGCLVGGKAAQRQLGREEENERLKDQWKQFPKPGDERWRQMSSKGWPYWNGLHSVDTFSDDG